MRDVRVETREVRPGDARVLDLQHDLDVARVDELDRGALLDARDDEARRAPSEEIGRAHV